MRFKWVTLLNHIKNMVENILFFKSKTIKDYITKIEKLSKDVEELGKMIYKEDKNIRFSYHSGTFVSNTDKFGISIYDLYIKSTDYKYSFTISSKSDIRELKIDLLLSCLELHTS